MRSSTTSICATTSPARCSEYWYHGGGCRAWLKVGRNTLTHEIKSVEPAAGAGAAKVGALMADQRRQSHRLASGGLIDRAAPLNFTFDGKTFAGFQGDTLASALVANGVKLVGRSFKYHRPRGIAHRRLGRAQRAGRVAQRRAARAQHQGDHGRTL